MKPRDYLLRAAKHSYRKVRKPQFSMEKVISDRKIANDLIYDCLQTDGGVMISRFGTTELISINNYLCINSDKPYLRRLLDYVTDNTQTPWWFEDHFKYLEEFSGVFPPTIATSEEFARLYLNDIPEIDLLGSFQYQEKFMPLNPRVKKVHLECLYPFFVGSPWTRYLEGKKVLVIHPFESSILKQYKRREKLFPNQNTLPEFDLITIRAVQSAAGIETKYSTWFDALKDMEDQIKQIDFDVCLLGCGAYGLPLAAMVKRMKKKAIHLGGGLQLLFGIRGKRWDDPNYLKRYSDEYPELSLGSYCSLYNDFWIKPMQEDTPQQANKLDNGIYW